MPADWITLIVPVAGVCILVGVVIVGWMSIRERGPEAASP